jgi:hypothetical protein
MFIPPYDGVRLVEFWDRLELRPVGWFRDCISLGRYKANEVGFEPGEEMFCKWQEIMGSNEIWVVVNWMVFDDGSDIVDHVINCRPGTTLESAQKVFEGLKAYLSSSSKDRGTQAGLERLRNQIRHVAPLGLWLTHGNAGESDGEHPDTQAIVHSYSDQKTDETREMYQARLKALAGMQPRTVALMQQAEDAKDETQRQKWEREAVHAFFAELAPYWVEDMVMAWQRNNPVGSKFLCEFGRVMEAPERELDLINHELALNWLRRGYNLMTENELSGAVFKATGQRVKPNTLRKKRGKLGLATKRPFGPWQRLWHSQ